MERSANGHLEMQHEDSQEGKFHSDTLIHLINNSRALLDPADVLNAASGR